MSSSHRPSRRDLLRAGLAGRTWDVVIDNSGYFPRMVAASAQLLAANASQYIFISSISAYDENPEAGGASTSPPRAMRTGQ